jgi:ankyrin repeat protein
MLLSHPTQSALLVCAHGGFYGCVKALLNVPGIHVDTADKRGLTPLHAAAIMGRTLIVKALLAHSPAPDVLTVCARMVTFNINCSQVKIFLNISLLPARFAFLIFIFVKSC